MERLDASTYFENHAHEYDHWHRKNHHYYDLLQAWFQFVVPKGKRVFELGMGDGNLSGSLASSELAGIDISPTLVEKARERYPNGKWMAGDISNGFEVGTTFDYVLGADFLPYVNDIQGVLERVHDLCHEKTRVVFTKLNPYWNFPLRIAALVGVAQVRMYPSWLSLSQTSQLVEVAGFEIIRSGKMCLCPVKIPLFSTLLNRFVSKLPLFWRACAIEYVIARVDPMKQHRKDRPSVSVVIPARNEAGNVESALRRMPALDGKLEVLFVEGHSTDDTWATIQKAQGYDWPFTVRALRQDGKGKGDAVRKGFDSARGELIMILDADLTVAPELLTRFYRILADGTADYVQGTRLIYPMGKNAMRPLNWLGNKFFSSLLSMLLGQRFSDTLCGTKCLWRSDYQLLAANRGYFGELDPFGDFDLIFGAAKLNLKMKEIPVRYQERLYGETNIQRFRDGWLLTRMCLLAARKLYFI